MRKPEKIAECIKDCYEMCCIDSSSFQEVGENNEIIEKPVAVNGIIDIELVETVAMELGLDVDAILNCDVSEIDK